MKTRRAIIIMMFVLLALTTQAHAGGSPQGSATAQLPIKATIINLTTMPIEKALLFCNERNMACPAIREKIIASDYSPVPPRLADKGQAERKFDTLYIAQ